VARRTCSRWKITGTLVTEGPLHVGGLGGDEHADLSMATDGEGNFFVPGTSLAGVFLAWFRGDGASQGELDELFGAGPGGAFEGSASHFSVEDGRISGATEEVQEGIGIDRITGATAPRALYSRAVVAAGAKIDLAACVEFPTEEKKRLWGPMIAALVDALKQGEIRVGAATNAGLGAVRLTGEVLHEQDMGTPKGVVDYLNSRATGGHGVRLNRLPASLPSAGPARWEISLNLIPDGPLMVKASQDGNAVDGLPRTTLDKELVKLAIPGRSIRGALRSCGERIVRTVLGKRAPAGAFLGQVKVPLIEHLFGSAGEEHALPGDTRGKGALRVGGCLGDPGISFARWRAIERASDEASLRAALDDAGWSSVDHAFHVAVDRWTGGAAEHLLFSLLEPRGIKWSPLVLSVELGRLPAGLRLPAVMLLLLTLRELTVGRVPVGHGVNRGYGVMKVSGGSSRVRGANDLAMLDHIAWDGGELRPARGFEQPWGLWSGELERAWNTWINEERGRDAQILPPR